MLTTSKTCSLAWAIPLIDQRQLSGLYAITDPDLLPGNRLISACEQALANGVRILQYRNKSADFEERLAQAIGLKALCLRYHALLLINDDVELCLGSQADGVHIGQRDTSLTDARQRLGSQAIIGVTCHNNIELAVQAEREGANYVAIGRFFPSHTKPDAPAATLNELRRMKAATSLPIVAIGGITKENAPQLIHAGADMLAVIHYLFSTPDIAQRAQALHALFHTDF